MKTYLLIEVKHTKPIPDLADKAAGRIYTMNHVEDVQVNDVTALTDQIISLPVLDYDELKRS